jgi:UDP-glucose 4-epimerase
VRVLVTGSSGFLGPHIVRHLASGANCDVTGFDLQAPPDHLFPAIEADFCDLGAIRQAVRGMDAVVHLGGVGDVYLATARPELAAQANVVGTTNVAIAAAEAGARVVYASTWEVYGPPSRTPVDEQHPCRPGHIYGATKLAGEQILNAVHQHDNLPVIVLRLGTAYGPGMRPNTVFSRFADAARAGQPLLVQGSGGQWRQFTHTSDIARAVALAVASDVEDATLNVVADESVTILGLAELAAKRYRSTVTFGPERHGDPPSARIASAAAARTLGWRPEVVFEQGLAELFGDLDARHNARPVSGD